MLPRALRWGAVALAFALTCWLYDNYGRRLFTKPSAPQPAGPSPLAREIQEGLDSARYNRILRDYRFVQTLLEQAAREGHDIRLLAARMPRALELARTGDYDGAKLQLNLIEVRIPRKKEGALPANADDAVLPPPKPRARRRAKR